MVRYAGGDPCSVPLSLWKKVSYDGVVDFVVNQPQQLYRSVSICIYVTQWAVLWTFYFYCTCIISHCTHHSGNWWCNGYKHPQSSYWGVRKVRDILFFYLYYLFIIIILLLLLLVVVSVYYFCSLLFVNCMRVGSRPLIQVFNKFNSARRDRKCI